MARPWETTRAPDRSLVIRLASAYGLRLRSNRPVPGLIPRSEAPAAPDLSIIFGERPRWATVGNARHRAYDDDRHQLSYDDGTEFFIDARGARIWATWPASLTIEDTATYLLGPVLGFYLRLRGLVCLHASAVMLDGRCVAFLGPAGSGKSTLAAAFAAQGHAIVTEDVACLDESGGAFAVRPGYPRIRLWEDSARLLRNSALPLLTPNWDKHYRTGTSATSRSTTARITSTRSRRRSRACSCCSRAPPWRRRRASTCFPAKRS
jgi:hypothetical protein